MVAGIHITSAKDCIWVVCYLAVLLHCYGVLFTCWCHINLSWQLFKVMCLFIVAGEQVTQTTGNREWKILHDELIFFIAGNKILKSLVSQHSMDAGLF